MTHRGPLRLRFGCSLCPGFVLGLLKVGYGLVLYIGPFAFYVRWYHKGY